MITEIVSLEIGNFYIIRDDYFIMIEDLPFNYSEKKVQYIDYFNSLFKKYVSMFLSMNVDLHITEPPKALYLINYCNGDIVYAIGKKKRIGIDRRWFL